MRSPRRGPAPPPPTRCPREGRSRRALALRFHERLLLLLAALLVELAESGPLPLRFRLAPGFRVGAGQGEVHLGAAGGQPDRGLQLPRPTVQLSRLREGPPQRMVGREEAGGELDRL